MAFDPPPAPEIALLESREVDRSSNRPPQALVDKVDARKKKDKRRKKKKKAKDGSQPPQVPREVGGPMGYISEQGIQKVYEWRRRHGISMDNPMNVTEFLEATEWRIPRAMVHRSALPKEVANKRPARIRPPASGDVEKKKMETVSPTRHVRKSCFLREESAAISDITTFDPSPVARRRDRGPLVLAPIEAAEEELRPLVLAPIEAAKEDRRPLVLAPIEAAEKDRWPLVLSPIEAAKEDRRPLVLVPIEAAEEDRWPLVLAPVEAAEEDRRPLVLAPIPVETAGEDRRRNVDTETDRKSSALAMQEKLDDAFRLRYTEEEDRIQRSRPRHRSGRKQPHDRLEKKQPQDRTERHRPQKPRPRDRLETSETAKDGLEGPKMQERLHKAQPQIQQKPHKDKPTDIWDLFKKDDDYDVSFGAPPPPPTMMSIIQTNSSQSAASFPQSEKTLELSDFEESSKTPTSQQRLQLIKAATKADKALLDRLLNQDTQRPPLDYI